MKTAMFATMAALTLNQASYADCTDVIKLSKITSEVVQNRDSFESNASAFCKEYKSTSTTAKSANYGLSYKFLAASMGTANASETEVASKVCSSDASQSSRADAYRQYVESISDKAYSAYEACERMKSAEITFTLNSLLNKSITISVGNSSKKAAPAQIAFDASGGATCEWKIIGQKQDILTLPTGSSALLKCSRSNIEEEAAITITETSSASGNSLTIPWAALDKNGVPIDHIKLLNKKVENSVAQLEAITKQIVGAVIPFKASECPNGWAEYEPAKGRFIRGIDRSGTIDPDGKTRVIGSIQDDDVKAHTHPYKDIYWSEAWGTVAGSLWGNKGDQDRDNKGYEMDRTTVSNQGSESRPKNVSLLYCIKN